MKTYKSIGFIVVVMISLGIYLGLKKNRSFVIVVASYNNQEWYRYNLNSIFAQTYKNYRVIYIDDCSPDGTGEAVKEYLASHDLENKVTLIHNGSRKGSLANHYTAVHACNDDEIIVCLDGDDWFAHDQVLEDLNEVYKDSFVWLTYSQFCNWPTGEIGWSEEYPDEVIATNTFRKFGFVCPQLRTYYAGLAKRVQKSDLLLSHKEQEKFFPIAGDVALMFPMLEMAHQHIRFIPEVLCQRNVASPLNDFKVNPDLQLDITSLIRAKKSYTAIKKIR